MAQPRRVAVGGGVCVSKPKTRHCDECRHCTFHDCGDPITCGKGHKPRFYMPRGDYPHYENDWGWKRRCEDFQGPIDFFEEYKEQVISKVILDLEREIMGELRRWTPLSLRIDNADTPQQHAAHEQE